MDRMPEWRILGYQPTRPQLRLLRLPEEAIEPSPVPLNAAHALDRAFARDGWLVFNPNEEVWGVPVPLEGRAFRVGRWWDCVSSPNPRTIWLANPIDPDPDVRIDRHAPTVISEYDGVARRELVRTQLPQSLSLEAAVPDGLIVVPHNFDADRELDVLSLWPYKGERIEPIAPGCNVIAAHGTRLAVGHRDGGLTLVDTASCIETAISPPLPGGWRHGGSFSPDGAWYATTAREDDSAGSASPRLAYAGGLTESPQQTAKRLDAPQWTRLTIIDCATGVVTTSEDHFNNFATDPVWSQDSSWLLFDAPFDNSMFACNVRKAPSRLTPVVRRRGRLSPLIDVTAITS